MSVTEYKASCNRPDAFNRGVLEDTVRVLSVAHPVLASQVREILAAEPISKPMLHDGDDSTDYFLVELSVDDAGGIADALGSAEGGAVGINSETTSKASHYGALHDVWANYVEFRDAAEI
jgi:hypothetical protein